MSVSGKQRIVLGLEHTNDGEIIDAFERLPTIDFDVVDGTESGEMDLLWHDQRTISASSSEDLDLSGSLVDSFGTTMTFVDVRLLVVKASADNTNDVEVGGAGSNTFINWVGDATDKVIVKPDGMLYLYSPADPSYAVTAGTGDILKIANSGSGTSVTYDIYIGGVSA